MQAGLFFLQSGCFPLTAISAVYRGLESPASAEAVQEELSSAKTQPIGSTLNSNAGKYT